MNDLLEPKIMAKNLVHWPSGITYACDPHAVALQKIGSAMGIHIHIEDYANDDKDKIRQVVGECDLN